MTAVAFVFARGGSKGLPGKNLRLLGGKPLLVWAVEQALAVSSIQRVIVSTDSEAIAAAARHAGADVPFLRPAELAQDDTPEWHAWRHALQYLSDEEGSVPDAMLSVPTTSPLRHASDLEACLREFSRGDADAVITTTEAHRNPYFNMVSPQPDGTVSPVISMLGPIVRRQDAPAVRDITTVAYVLDPRYVMTHDSLFAGRVRAVDVPPERAVDIDTQLDLDFAEFLLSKRTSRA